METEIGVHAPLRNMPANPTVAWTVTAPPAGEGWAQARTGGNAVAAQSSAAARTHPARETLAIRK
ncbi:MAG: hypothetical protein CW345_03430 [Firmicutes bacterium]|nr:hypothetical protein [Bacillota bacterium]MBO2520844.1 hypothetical protein [Bacillota bacterium]